MVFKEIVVDETFIKKMDEYRQPDKTLGLIAASSKNIVVFVERMLGLRPDGMLVPEFKNAGGKRLGHMYSWQVYALLHIQKAIENRRDYQIGVEVHGGEGDGFIKVLIDSREFIIITSRQIGKSAMLAMLSLWACVFNKLPCGAAQSTSVIVISASDVQAKKLLYEMKKFLRMGDRFLRDTYQDENGKPIFGESFFSDLLDDNEPNNTTTITFKPHNPKVHKDILLSGSSAGSKIQSYAPTPVVLGETGSLLIEDEAGKTDRITDQFHYDYLYPTGNSTDAVRVYTSTPWLSCYDDQTEVLTKAGWKRFADVDITKDKIATRDLHNNVWFTTASNKVASAYKGDMYSFNTKTVDLLVTPNHRMIGRFQKSQVRRVVFAEDLANKKTDFWMDTNLGVYTPEQYKNKTIIPSITYVRGKGKCTVPERVVNTNELLRFLGMFVSDGHFVTSGNRIEITQNKGPRLSYYADLAKKLFPDLDIKVIPHAKSYRIQIHSKQIMEFFKPIKSNGIDVWQYTDEQLEWFWQGVWDGDGSKTRTWKNNLVQKKVFMDSKYPKLNECVSLVQQRLFGASILYEKPVKDSNVQYISAHNASRSKIKTYTEQLTKTQYDGMVYCVTVPTGELYVRRGGKSVWSGNSGFFYRLVDPDNIYPPHNGVIIAFTIDAIRLENPMYYKTVMKTVRQLNADGKRDEVQRAYYCRFVKGEQSYFDPEDVLKIFANRELRMQEFESKPCDIGVDFGGQVTSRSVLTISLLQDDNNIHRLYCKTYGVGLDTDMVDDIAELKTKFNIQRIIVDDCPAGQTFIRQMEERGWEVVRMNFRSEKVKKYGSFRVALKRGRVHSYNDDELKTEMMAMEYSKSSRQSYIQHAPGYSDDLMDSFLMSCYHFIDDEEGVQAFEW